MIDTAELKRTAGADGGDGGQREAGGARRDTQTLKRADRLASSAGP